MKLHQTILAAALIASGITAAQAAQLSGGIGLTAGQIDGFVVHQTAYGLNGDDLHGNYRSLNASLALAQRAGPGAVVLGLDASYSLGGSMSGQGHAMSGNPASNSGGDLSNLISNIINAAPSSLSDLTCRRKLESRARRDLHHHGAY